VAESFRLTDLVKATLDAFLDRQGELLDAISPDLAPVHRAARDLLTGGKRFRARFCYWGWRAVAAAGDEFDPMPADIAPADRAAVITIASALEILHAAALVHDDIIDRSATRRGAPAAHERFASMHRDGGWAKDSDRFGAAAAILLGDLLLSWADTLFDEGASLLGDAVAAKAAKAEFQTMRTEVTVGQYLDVLEEHSWVSRSDDDAAARAQRVVIYKSAKYSVEAPLVIGALLAGASADQVGALREYGVPLGVAFQLRDDMLGVYGDPAVTGKPAGDDLREGKRTVLIALTRAALPTSARRFLDELLGDPELDDEQIEMLRGTIRESGAVTQLELAIGYNLERAVGALNSARIAPGARRALVELAEAVSRREA